MIDNKNRRFKVLYEKLRDEGPYRNSVPGTYRNSDLITDDTRIDIVIQVINETDETGFGSAKGLIAIYMLFDLMIFVCINCI